MEGLTLAQGVSAVAGIAKLAVLIWRHLQSMTKVTEVRAAPPGNAHVCRQSTSRMRLVQPSLSTPLDRCWHAQSVREFAATIGTVETALGKLVKLKHIVAGDDALMDEIGLLKALLERIRAYGELVCARVKKPSRIAAAFGYATAFVWSVEDEATIRENHEAMQRHLIVINIAVSIAEAQRSTAADATTHDGLSDIATVQAAFRAEMGAALRRLQQ